MGSELEGKGKSASEELRRNRSSSQIQVLPRRCRVKWRSFVVLKLAQRDLDIELDFLETGATEVRRRAIDLRFGN